MQTLLLKTDDAIYEQIKAFLSLIPKEKVEVIDPFEIGYVSADELKEIEEILKNPQTGEIVEASKRTYTI